MQPDRSGGDWGGALHILDCEHTIWMGDLNYRLQGMQGPEVLAAIQKGGFGGWAKGLAASEEHGSLWRAVCWAWRSG
jgi:hypothetical protein